MRIQTFEAWGKTERVVTDPSETEYVGVAIGPGSDEGLVVVNDVPLQAGRILPFRQKKYSVKRARPIAPRNEAGADDGGFACLRQLSLLMFEDVAELGACVVRPDGNYDATNIVVAAPATLAISVPFSGRREAQFMLTSETIGAGAFGYTVKGVRWNRSSRFIERYVLHADAAATMSADETLVFYIGGNDNAEKWDALELYLDTNGTYQVDVDTIGELGL